jgi:hypothetical protein
LLDALHVGRLSELPQPIWLYYKRNCRRDARPTSKACQQRPTSLVLRTHLARYSLRKSQCILDARITRVFFSGSAAGARWRKRVGFAAGMGASVKNERLKPAAVSGT